MRHECVIKVVLLLGLMIAIAVDLAYSEPRFGIINGEVEAIDSGSPVVNAQVRLEPTSRTTVTDQSGRFEFADVPQGVYAVTVTHPDFLSGRVGEIAVRVDRISSVNVKLQRVPRTDAERPGSIKQSAKEEPILDEQKDISAQSGRMSTPSPYATDQLAPLMKKSRDYERGNEQGSYYPVPEPDNVYVAPPQDMYFRDYGTNRFVQTSRDRFSTFAVDVDDASYNIARKYLIDGNMPPTEAIRVEEFVNHFDYGYARPEDGRFRVFTELTGSPFDRSTYFMKIGVKAREIAEQRRKPLNLTIVIDVSGSMGYDNRMDLVKRSLDLLLAQLDGGDRVGIVAYGSSARVVLNPTSANQRNKIAKAIHRLSPGGSTYAEAGLKLGYQMANRMNEYGENNLVILLSDGVANVGQTSPDAIMRDIKRYVSQGITLSTFGFGMGNYNDVLLERLAQQGNGRYAYVNDLDQAGKLFVENIMGTLQVVARDVKVQVEFNASAVSSYRLLGYENRAVPDQKFRDNRQDGGEVGSGHEVTALYELTLNRRAESANLATVFVRWKNPNETKVTEISRTVTMDRRMASFASARPELGLAIVAAKFAELLKETRYSGGISYHELMPMAQAIDRQLHTEQTRDLVDLIGRADNLTGYFGQYRYDADDNYEDDVDD